MLAGAGPARMGYRAVVLGHTPRQGHGGCERWRALFNTGPRANLMPFPASLSDSSRPMRLELDDDGRLLAGELGEYDWKREQLT